MISLLGGSIIPHRSNGSKFKCISIFPFVDSSAVLNDSASLHIEKLS